MTRTLPLNRPYDDSGLAHGAPAASAPSLVSAAASPLLSRYHHSHFIAIEPGEDDGQPLLRLRPFTGEEPEPQRPLASYRNPALTGLHRDLLAAEYETVRAAWSHARLRLHATPLLRQAVASWAAWEDTHTTLQEVFQAFWETPDGMLNAQALRLLDAERAANAAAVTWDTLAARLAGLARDQMDVADDWRDELQLTSVARDLGLEGADRWWIDHASAYERDPIWGGATPLVESLRKTIRAQRTQLREAADIVADVATARRLGP